MRDVQSHLNSEFFLPQYSQLSALEFDLNAKDLLLYDFDQPSLSSESLHCRHYFEVDHFHGRHSTFSGMTKDFLLLSLLKIPLSWQVLRTFLEWPALVLACRLMF